MDFRGIVLYAPQGEYSPITSPIGISNMTLSAHSAIFISMTKSVKGFWIAAILLAFNLILNQNAKLGASDTISTFAGNGTLAYSGDGGPAAQASFDYPMSVCLDSSGNVLVADLINGRVRSISSSGIISTLAGNGSSVALSTQDGQPMALARIQPYDIAFDAQHNMYILEDYIIIKIGSDGIIHRIAGLYNATVSYSGDGGPANAACISSLGGIFCDASGNLYLCDTNNYRIRKIDTNGIITTIAGNGTAGNSGNGGPAINANIGTVWGGCIDSAGNIYIAETGNGIIRKIDTNGIITLIAGNNTGSDSGDGGSALSAGIAEPRCVVVLANGDIYIGEQGARVRKVSGGIITTVVGTGVSGYSGDGGPATQAEIESAVGLAFDSSGNYYIADESGSRVRKITHVSQPPTVATAASANPNPTTGKTTALSVLGADVSGESILSYTWSATTVPTNGTVGFSPNGTNAAKHATATFNEVGTYTLQCTISDGTLSVTSSVNVIVSPTLSVITITPSNGNVAVGKTLQFSATGSDQFGVRLTSQPTFSTWTLNSSSAGTVSSSGLLTAGTTTGSYTVYCTSGSVQESTTINVRIPPTVAQVASASPNPTSGTTTTLSILGSDPAGESTLIYTWSTIGTPPAGVIFATGGTNDAKNTLVSFAKAGVYNFSCLITDSFGLTASSSVSVTVTQTLTSIAVSATPTNLYQHQQFTRTGFDQFNQSMATQPTVTWTLSGAKLGTISSSGYYASNGDLGGPYTVTATSGSIAGTAQVTTTSTSLIVVTGDLVGSSGQPISETIAISGATGISQTVALTGATFNGGGTSKNQSTQTTTQYTIIPNSGSTNITAEVGTQPITQPIAESIGSVATISRFSGEPGWPSSLAIGPGNEFYVGVTFTPALPPGVNVQFTVEAATSGRAGQATITSASLFSGGGGSLTVQGTYKTETGQSLQIRGRIPGQKKIFCSGATFTVCPHEDSVKLLRHSNILGVKDSDGDTEWGIYAYDYRASDTKPNGGNADLFDVQYMEVVQQSHIDTNAWHSGDIDVQTAWIDATDPSTSDEVSVTYDAFIQGQSGSVIFDQLYVCHCNVCTANRAMVTHSGFTQTHTTVSVEGGGRNTLTTTKAIGSVNIGAYYPEPGLGPDQTDTETPHP